MQREGDRRGGRALAGPRRESRDRDGRRDATVGAAPISAKFAVFDLGEMCGSVSGGCVENDVAVQAQEVIASGEPRLLSYGISDEQALGVGLPVRRRDRRLPRAPRLTITERLLELAHGDERAVFFTVLEGDAAGASCSCSSSAARPTATPVELEALAPEVRRNGQIEHEGRRSSRRSSVRRRASSSSARSIRARRCAPRRRQSAGTRSASTRASVYATPDRVPSADEIVVEWPERRSRRITPDRDTAVIVLTHDDKFDIPALAVALRTDAFYVGALGSRRAQSKRRERLLERASTRPSSSGCAARQGSTSVQRARPRRQCRSSPRRWRCAPGGSAARCEKRPAASTSSGRSRASEAVAFDRGRSTREER